MNETGTWVIFGILSLLCEVGFVLNSKKFLNSKMRNYDPVSLAATFYLLTFILSFIYSILIVHENIFADYKNLTDHGYGIYLVVNLILYTFAPYLYWTALKNIAASETSLIYSFLGVHTLWLGFLFFGKAIHIYAILGILILFISQILVEWKSEKIKFGKYQIFMILATLMYAAAYLTDSIILESHMISVTSHMTGRFLIPAFILFLFFPWRIKNAIEVADLKGSKKFLIINTFLMFGSYFFFYYAYEIGAPAAAIASILGMESLLMVIIENKYIGKIENFNIKICASILAICGIILLSI